MRTINIKQKSKNPVYAEDDPNLPQKREKTRRKCEQHLLLQWGVKTTSWFSIFL